MNPETEQSTTVPTNRKAFAICFFIPIIILVSLFLLGGQSYNYAADFVAIESYIGHPTLLIFHKTMKLLGLILLVALPFSFLIPSIVLRKKYGKEIGNKGLFGAIVSAVFVLPLFIPFVSWVLEINIK